jgi:hypothetical protein
MGDGNVVQLVGTIAVSSQSACDNPFPGATSLASLSLCPSAKPATVDTGMQRPNIDSAGSFVTLAGIGAASTVTAATFIYFRSIEPFILRETTKNPLGSPLVVAYPVQGLHVREYPPGSELTLLEAEGEGQVEYYASGNE